MSAIVRVAPSRSPAACVAVGACLAALALPSAAAGKIPLPSSAVVSGSGMAPIAIGSNSSGLRTVAALAGYSSLYAAVLPGDVRPRVRLGNRGSLGPRYTITYRISRWRRHRRPTPIFVVTQQVYPYARGGPVAYVRPGQRVFNFRTRGGWFGADHRLARTLLRVGLPRAASLPAPATPHRFLIASAVAAALGAGLVAAATVTRRAGRAAAPERPPGARAGRATPAAERARG